MILKLIIIKVKPDLVRRFDTGQQQWKALRRVEGFCGQTGGWIVDSPTQTVIVGLWRDRTCHDHFMAHVHDGIFEANGQKGTYESSEISLWHRVLDIPGRVATMPSAVAGGQFMRIALCRLQPNRRRHFVDVQRSVWNPGMAESGGMLAGIVCESSDSSDRFLVCTLWHTEADHLAYRAGPFHILRRQAEVERDCDSIMGYFVRIEPMWRAAHADGTMPEQEHG